MYTYVYIKSDVENEIICSGIRFYEFSNYFEPKIENIILLKGDYLGSKCVRNFELFEGQEQIERLAKEMKKPCNHFGDFHLIDYSENDAVSKLTDEDIKNILYRQSKFFRKKGQLC